MTAKKKITYSSIVDEKFSFFSYNDSLSQTNREVIRKQCEILNYIITNKLSKKQQRILNLYYYENYKMKDIANIIGIDKSTVSRSIKRSKSKIKEYMNFSNFRQ